MFFKNIVKTDSSVFSRPQNDGKGIRHTERIFGRVESSKASELVSRRFSTERLRQSLKVKSRKSTARKSKTA